MARYNMDMSRESERKIMELADGWYDFEVAKMEEGLSKAGNPMFTIKLALNSDPSIGCEVYAIMEEGKRWFLKQLLEACGLTPDESGVFSFDIPDIEGQVVSCKVENQKETYINRNNEEVTKTKSRVVGFNRAKAETEILDLG